MAAPLSNPSSSEQLTQINFNSSAENLSRPASQEGKMVVDDGYTPPVTHKFTTNLPLSNSAVTSKIGKTIQKNAIADKDTASIGKIDFSKRKELKERNGGEDVTITVSGSNKRLEGMYFPKDETGKSNHDVTTVLICSGRHQSFEHYVKPLVDGYQDMDRNLNVMVFNYSGFGMSGGEATPQTIVESSEIALQFLTEQMGIPLDKVAVHGYSMGGYPAAKLAENHPEIPSLILDRTFHKYSDVGRDTAYGPTAGKILEKCTKKFLKSANMENAYDRNHLNMDIGQTLAAVKGGVYIVRAREDKTMRPEYAEQNLASASSEAHIIDVDGGHERNVGWNLPFSQKSKEADDKKEAILDQALKKQKPPT